MLKDSTIAQGNETLCTFLNLPATLYPTCLLRCGLSFANRTLHNCTVQQGGAVENIDNLPTDFNPSGFTVIQNSHNGAFIHLSYPIDSEEVDFTSVFVILQDALQSVLQQFVSHVKGIKFSITLKTSLERVSDGFVIERDFFGPFITLTHVNFIPEKTSASLDYLLSSLSLYEKDGSGWRVLKVHSASVRITWYKPQLMRGSRVRDGGKYIELPKSMRRRGLINIKSYNNNCFMLCVLAKLYLHCIRLSDEPKLTYDELNAGQRKRIKRIYEDSWTWEEISLTNAFHVDFSGFKDYVRIEDISLFEQKNTELSVNVYMLDGDAVFPVRVAESIKLKHVDLLLLEDGKDKEGHFVLIPDLGKLYGKRGYRKTDVCRKCFQPFSENTKKHSLSCQGLNLKRKLSLPKKDVFKFDKFYSHMDVNFKLIFRIKYFSCQNSVDRTNQDSCMFTIPEETSDVAGYTLALFDPNWELDFDETYFGHDPIGRLLTSIHKLSMKSIAIVKNKYVPLAVTPGMEQLKSNTKQCMLCHSALNDKDRKPAFNHLHFTGLLYSIICVPCNILVVKKAIVVISHGFSQRDSFAILRCLKPEWINSMDIIAKSNKCIISFNWLGSIKFIDSMELINSDIGELNNWLLNESIKNPNAVVYKLVRAKFGNELDPNIYTRHIIFPSEYISYYSKIKGPFPNRNSFDLFELEEYPMAFQDSKYLFEHKKCKSVDDYATIFNETQLFQLADAIKHFTQWCIKNFNISPLHSPTLAAFGFDAIFVKTGSSFQHIKDESIISWVSNGLKAGLSFANVRLASANNERIGLFDGVDKNRSHIIELDINGAYAAGASHNLCKGDYYWLSDMEISHFDLSLVEEEGEYGYIIEVDIHIPQHLHNYHDPLPPAVTRRKVEFQELSNYQQELWNKIGNPINSTLTHEKLILDLNDKNNYVVYHKLLKLYVSKGTIIRRIHKILRFTTAPYLKSGVDFIMDLRLEAIRKEDKLINKTCKAILCGIFGKFMSNTSEYTDVKTCTSQTECIHMTAKPSFTEISSISNHLSLIHFKRNTVHHPYNIINAFIILENCRYLVYDGWYFLREYFNDNIVLLAGETDSLRLKILDPSNEFIYKMKQLTNVMDFSALPKSHELYSNLNECRLGYWKLVSMNISEFISIKSKLFSYINRCDKCQSEYTVDCEYCNVYGRGKSGASGVHRFIKSRMTHNFYRHLLSSEVLVNIKNNGLSKNFNCLDTRRYFESNHHFHSFAFGNTNIQNGNREIPIAVAKHGFSDCS
jgi:hypothetical protein